MKRRSQTEKDAQVDENGGAHEHRRACWTAACTHKQQLKHNKMKSRQTLSEEEVHQRELEGQPQVDVTEHAATLLGELLLLLLLLLAGLWLPLCLSSLRLRLSSWQWLGWQWRRECCCW